MRQTTNELARRKYERERREAIIAGIRAMRPKPANPHDRRFDPVEDRVTAWQARYHEARRALGHRS